MIIEVIKPATDAKYLQEHCGGVDHNAFRTEPPDIVMTDYEKTEILLGCGIYTLVNLNNMQVLEPLCGDSLKTAEKCLADYV